MRTGVSRVGEHLTKDSSPAPDGYEIEHIEVISCSCIDNLCGGVGIHLRNYTCDLLRSTCVPEEKLSRHRDLKGELDELVLHCAREMLNLSRHGEDWVRNMGPKSYTFGDNSKHFL